MLQNEYLVFTCEKSASIQPRRSPDKFAVRLRLASSDLGSSLSLVNVVSWDTLSECYRSWGRSTNHVDYVSYNNSLLKFFWIDCVRWVCRLSNIYGSPCSATRSDQEFEISNASWFLRSLFQRKLLNKFWKSERKIQSTNQQKQNNTQRQPKICILRRSAPARYSWPSPCSSWLKNEKCFKTFDFEQFNLP